MKNLLIGKTFLIIVVASRINIVDSSEAISVAASAIQPGTATSNDVIMIPKYRQNNHDQMVLGARLAQKELSSQSASTAPNVVASYPLSRENSKNEQISIVQDATALGVQAIMMANVAGELVENYTMDAAQKGIPVVTYDSPLKGGLTAGESMFVSPVDFRLTGVLMADMALSILGDQGGDFVMLCSTPNAANQIAWIASLKNALESEKYSKLTLVGVYYPYINNAVGFEEITLQLVELRTNGTFPNLSLIMAPTTSGATASARALYEHEHCDIMQVSGLAMPAEMLEASQAGCAPEFALWNNLDVGYLAYHATHALVSGQIEGGEGDIIDAGKLGSRQIQLDPARNNSLWIILGDFIKYDIENVERAASVDCIMGFCGDAADYFEQRFMDKYKKKALAIIPKFTGMLSFLCSGFLVQHILRSQKQRKSPYSRIIVGLSTADMFSSFFGFFLSTWPMPSDTWLAYGAAGNTQTCSMQGFFLQLGLCAATLYQASLVCYYFFTIVKGWSKTKVKKWEPVLHAIPCTVALGTAISGLVLRLYNPLTRGSLCWINEYPPYCNESISCERGEGAFGYRWGFVYGFVVATFAWLGCAMIMIFHSVHTTEKRSRKYRRRDDSSAHSQAREVAAQALLYSLAYCIPWIWTLILSFIDTGQGVFRSAAIDNSLTALNIVNVVVFPLQGVSLTGSELIF